MHNSAFLCAKNFYLKYLRHLKKDSIILDIGSYDHNGTLKPLFINHKYIGVDTIDGPNVDLVSIDRKIPFESYSCDVIVCSSTFEHDELFWITFLEMCRLLKNNGYIYINAPSQGPYHPYPVDCWRFKNDAYKALETWAKYNKYNINLIESYVDENDKEWNDSVGIFQKKNLQEIK